MDMFISSNKAVVVNILHQKDEAQLVSTAIDYILSLTSQVVGKYGAVQSLSF